jgi:hypothetical protein
MTTVSLRLRDDDVHHLDTVDLDRLTAPARALAEQIDRGPLANRRDIWLAHPDGDRTVWSGWAGYPADSAMDPHRYLEQQALKLAAGWRVIPMTDQQSAREAHLQLLKADAASAEHAFRALVVREAASRGAEAPVAREAGVDRMTVRKWAGK